MAQLEKDPGIETLRGLAILLIVAFHALHRLPENTSPFIALLQTALGFIRMPLFTVISGFVYALRPIAPGGSLNFLRGKARRLLVPMLCVGSLSLILSTKPPYIENPIEILGIWKILVFPFLHFWFIQALFLIFIVVTIIEHFRCLNKFRIWLCATLMAAVPGFFVRPDDFGSINLPFSMDGALFLLPYFLFGLGLHRFAERLKNRRIAIGAFAIAFCGITLGLLKLPGKIDIPHHKGSLLYLAVSSSLIFVLFRFRMNVAPLRKLGDFAYSIYLFHIYVIAVGIFFLMASGISVRPPILFCIVFLSGLLVPILAHKLFHRFTLTRRLLLGLR